MNKHNQNKLMQELISEGASEKEANQLSGIAMKLSDLNAKSTNKPRRFTLIVASSSFIAAVVITFMVVVFSQTVLPGSPLYRVQKVSDNLAVSFNSSYRGTVMMKRAEQVKTLVNNNADPSLVMATLADYQTQASAYTNDGHSYAVYEYCKSNLKQAASTANVSEKQAIDNTLNSLKDV